jgi:hypothetical protein
MGKGKTDWAAAVSGARANPLTPDASAWMVGTATAVAAAETRAVFGMVPYGVIDGSYLRIAFFRESTNMPEAHQMWVKQPLFGSKTL